MPLSRWNPSDALARSSPGRRRRVARPSASVSTATDGDDLVITVDGVNPSDVDVQSPAAATVRAEAARAPRAPLGGRAPRSLETRRSVQLVRPRFSLPDGCHRVRRLHHPVEHNRR